VADGQATEFVAAPEAPVSYADEPVTTSAVPQTPLVSVTT
jgi:hypothetical protein